MVNPNTASNQDEFTTPNAKSAFEVTAKDLPVYCPVKGSSLWNSHPRVYMPVKENGGEAKCPYCGTIFKLFN